MSTEHQTYSTRHQMAAITRYAEDRGYDIVATYCDEDRSGLSIKRRKALQQLLADVLTGAAGFETVLVYDVSRWGRFQNPDQSAHYEFLCAEAGVAIEYCVEVFDNDGSLASVLLKSLKRAMAAEYSRDISVRGADDHARLAALGYWQGGPPGFGLRRQGVAPNGQLGVVLQAGEFKGIQGHRTILVPGPPEEVATVNRIYRLYAYAGMTQVGIARRLIAEGLTAEAGQAWTALRVGKVLTSRKYVGELEFRKTTGRLGGPRWRRPPTAWLRVPGAFAPIVSKKLFAAAQQARRNRNVSLSTPQMLAALRQLHQVHGHVSHRLIGETPGLPRGQAFAKRFGGLAQACEAIGQPRDKAPRATKHALDDQTILERLRALLARAGYLDTHLIEADASLPCARTIGRRFGGLRAAYFLVGYDRDGPGDTSTAIGRARAEATALQRARALGLVLGDRRPTGPAPAPPKAPGQA